MHKYSFTSTTLESIMAETDFEECLLKLKTMILLKKTSPTEVFGNDNSLRLWWQNVLSQRNITESSLLTKSRRVRIQSLVDLKVLQWTPDGCPAPTTTTESNSMSGSWQPAPRQKTQKQLFQEDFDDHVALLVQHKVDHGTFDKLDELNQPLATWYESQIARLSNNSHVALNRRYLNELLMLQDSKAAYSAEPPPRPSMPTAPTCSSTSSLTVSPLPQTTPIIASTQPTSGPVSESAPKVYRRIVPVSALHVDSQLLGLKRKVEVSKTPTVCVSPHPPTETTTTTKTTATTTAAKTMPAATAKNGHVSKMRSEAPPMHALLTTTKPEVAAPPPKPALRRCTIPVDSTKPDNQPQQRVLAPIAVQANCVILYEYRQSGSDAGYLRIGFVAAPSDGSTASVHRVLQFLPSKPEDPFNSTYTKVNVESAVQPQSVLAAGMKFTDNKIPGTDKLSIHGGMLTNNWRGTMDSFMKSHKLQLEGFVAAGWGVKRKK